MKAKLPHIPFAKSHKAYQQSGQAREQLQWKDALLENVACAAWRRTYRPEFIATTI